MTDNEFCHQMPSSPKTVEFNYLHICDNGPIAGRYVILRGVSPDYEILQIAEVFVWDGPQPEDKSEEHGKAKIVPVLK